jgi:hypothetical protein
MFGLQIISEIPQNMRSVVEIKGEQQHDWWIEAFENWRGSSHREKKEDKTTKTRDKNSCRRGIDCKNRHCEFVHPAGWNPNSITSKHRIENVNLKIKKTFDDFLKEACQQHLDCFITGACPLPQNVSHQLSKLVKGLVCHYQGSLFIQERLTEGIFTKRT